MIKEQAGLASGENPLSGLQMAFSHRVFTWQRAETNKFSGDSHKAINPIHEDSTLMTSSTPKGPISKYHHIGDKVSTQESGEDTNIQSIIA